MSSHEDGGLSYRVLVMCTGLDKLLNTAEDVKVMQKELEAMKPQLLAAQGAAQEMLVHIEADRVGQRTPMFY